MRPFLLKLRFFNLEEHAQGGDAGVLEAAETADVRDGAMSGLLAAILRHFPSAHIIEALRSICREAADEAADAAGWRLHKVGDVFMFLPLHDRNAQRLGVPARAFGRVFRTHGAAW